MFVRTFPIVVLFSLACASEAAAVEIPPAHHPWGRFPPNSWQRVRVITESFGPGDGKSVEITDVTTRLVKVEGDGVVLTREEKNGDRTAREENVKYAWDGSNSNETTREKYSIGEVDLKGTTYVCQTQQVTTEHEGATTVSKSWYCPDHSPYLLKKLTRVSGKQHKTSAMRVTRLAVMRNVIDQPRLCWEAKTIETTPTDVTRTTTFRTMEVPGGLVACESEIHDKQGGLMRRVRVELIAFEVAR
jgi:hypothetical protein